MAKKTANFDPESIDKLPQNQPVVYKIRNKKGENIYTGSSMRGQLVKRIKAHLPGGRDPIPGGDSVTIEQHSSIDDAKKSEKRIITRSKPKYNKKGK